jgi:hypothetical protein
LLRNHRDLKCGRADHRVLHWHREVLESFGRNAHIAVTNNAKDVNGIIGKLDSIGDRIALPPDQTSSKQPSVINVPCHRTYSFVGRSDAISITHQVLSPAEPRAGPKCAVLRGVGGQGKTSIAIEYCRRYLNQPYQLILWINASSEQLICRDLDAVDLVHGVPPGSPTTSSTIGAKAQQVFRYLDADDSPWLLVLDGVDNPDVFGAISSLMPSSPNASTLITTRHGQISGLATDGGGIELESMNTSDALQLLAQSMRCNVSDFEHGARHVVDALSNHPLAISQAGRYARKRRLPLSVFLQQFEKRKLAILREKPAMSDYWSDVDGTGILTSLSVFATLELSLSLLVKGEGVPCRGIKEDLLNIMAFSFEDEVSERPLENFCMTMSPWGMEEQMLCQPGAYLAHFLGEWDGLLFESTLAELEDIGLIRSFHINSEGYHVSVYHPLVKEWLKMRLDPETALQFSILVVELRLHDTVPPPDETDVPCWEELMAELLLGQHLPRSTTEDWITEAAARHPEFRRVLEKLRRQQKAFRSRPKDQRDVAGLCRAFQDLLRIELPGEDVAHVPEALADLVATKALDGIQPAQLRRTSHHLLTWCSSGTIFDVTSFGLVTMIADQLGGTPGFGNGLAAMRIFEACSRRRDSSHCGINPGRLSASITWYANLLDSVTSDNERILRLRYEALRLEFANSGPLSENSLSLALSLSKCLNDVNRFEEGETIARATYRVEEQVLGPNHWKSKATFMHIQNIIYGRRGDAGANAYAAEIQRYLRDLDEFSLEGGANAVFINWKRSQCFRILCNLYLSQGEVATATKFARLQEDEHHQLSSMGNANTTRDMKSVWMAKYLVADCLFRDGNLDEATEKVEAALHGFLEILHPSDIHISFCYNLIRRILDAKEAGLSRGNTALRK